MMMMSIAREDWNIEIFKQECVRKRDQNQKFIFIALFTIQIFPMQLNSGREKLPETEIRRKRTQQGELIIFCLTLGIMNCFYTTILNHNEYKSIVHVNVQAFNVKVYNFNCAWLLYFILCLIKLQESLVSDGGSKANVVFLLLTAE